MQHKLFIAQYINANDCFYLLFNMIIAEMNIKK